MLSNESGNIYRDCKLYNSKINLQSEIAKKLWEISAKFTGLESKFDFESSDKNK